VAAALTVLSLVAHGKGIDMHGHILVPLDGSALADRVFPYARALAEPGRELVLLRVVPEGESIYTLFGQPLMSDEEVRQMEERQALDDLERTASVVREWGLSAYPEVAVGDPAEQILRVAEARDIGLIAMTTHGRGAVGRLVYGSVADRVARGSSVPVLLVHPREEAAASLGPAVQRLVVPLDGSELAAEAVPFAATLAKQLAVPVHLVRAVEPGFALTGATGLSDTSPAVTAELYEQIYQQTKVDAESTLEQAASRLRDVAVTTTWDVSAGSAFVVIVDAVRPGDVIVMTSHGRSGVRRWLLGSVAEKLVREGPVSVILIPAPARQGVATPVAEAAMERETPSSP